MVATSIPHIITHDEELELQPPSNDNDDPSSSVSFSSPRRDGVVSRRCRIRPHPASLPPTWTSSFPVHIDMVPVVPDNDHAARDHVHTPIHHTILSTDVCIQLFADRVVFLVSQLPNGGVGHWFLWDHSSHSITTLLGGTQTDAHEAEGHVYVRQLATELMILHNHHNHNHNSMTAAATTTTRTATTTTPPLPPPSTTTTTAAAAGHATPTTLLLGMSLHKLAQGRPEVFRQVIPTLVTLYKQHVLLLRSPS